MKSIIQFISILFFSIFLIITTGCEQGEDTYLPEGKGRPGELVIVIDTTLQNSTTGRELEKIFLGEYPALPQPEPRFDVITIPHQNFSTIFKQVKNILDIQIVSKQKELIAVQKRNEWATNQLVVKIIAPSEEDLIAYLMEEGENIANLFEDEEALRKINDLKSIASEKHRQELENKFKINLLIDKYFITAKNDSNYIWYRKDRKLGNKYAVQNILIYSQPYIADSLLETKNIIAVRNKITKIMKGPAKGSYIKVFEDYEPDVREFSLKNTYVKEIRGLWDMENAFNGGPFVSYSFVNPNNNSLITIDVSVFAPGSEKRELVRELEAIALTLTY
jgi:hypothetical protein